VLWSLAVVLVSLLCTRGRDALLVLLAVWAVVVILLPRWVPDIANNVVSVPTRFENGIHVQREYIALGDSHNPDDPKFKAYKEGLLKQYGVTRIEDLPVNFKGLVGMEGERKSSALFNRYAAETFTRQGRQNAIVDSFGILAPTLALRRLSMAASGTDLANFRSFTEQGERYRYGLVQGLNRLQVEELAYADDTTPGKENRLSHDHWQAFPAFHFEEAPMTDTLRRIAPAGVILLAWLCLMSGLAWLLGGRLGRIA
jgi:ABC-2 type transport system permease protein